MHQRLLLDTDILVDMLRGASGIDSTIERLARDYEMATSAMSQMELIVGCRKKAEQKQVSDLVARLSVINITSLITDLAVKFLFKYRLSHGLLIPDAVIAATAVAEGVPLLTRNVRHFRGIESLRLH